jgi:pimeloyl-ACP methyl ester carboxylesterase
VINQEPWRISTNFGLDSNRGTRRGDAPIAGGFADIDHELLDHSAAEGASAARAASPGPPGWTRSRTPGIASHPSEEPSLREGLRLRIDERIPDSRLVVLRDCGHFSFAECPDELLAAIRGSLRQE